MPCKPRPIRAQLSSKVPMLKLRILHQVKDISHRLDTQHLPATGVMLSDWFRSAPCKADNNNMLLESFLVAK